jgi:hypothetical protein
MTNGKLWNHIREVSADEIPPQKGRSSPWVNLYAKLSLRLERTPSDRALEISFDSEKICTKARYGLQKIATKQHGSGFIRFRTACVDNRFVLYVRRGPNWSK